jgi:hypothetical protein
MPEEISRLIGARATRDLHKEKCLETGDVLCE